MGLSYPQLSIGILFSISDCTVRQLIRLLNQTGDIKPRT